MAPERMKMDIKQQLHQQLYLTPQMLQSMEVLQMNAQELWEHINAAVNENPLLEREDTSALQREYQQLRSIAGWLDAFGGSAAFSGEPVAEHGDPEREIESLTGFLRDQLERMALEKPLLELCRYLAYMVDEDGYLTEEDLQAVAHLRVPQELIDRALAVLQSLEPAGVAARDLPECLLLQLQRQRESDPIVLAVARNHLTQLSYGHYEAIARTLQCAPRQVRAAEERIAQLEPHPGRAFAVSEETVYVRPDVFVLERDGRWQVVLNEFYLPRVSISSYYVRMMQDSPDRETEEYLCKKMQHAQWLLRNLEQRNTTLRRCGEAILQRQQPFFEGKTSELAPVTQRQLAQELQVHPSTVTRALRGKYLQCRQGTFPMRHFFSRPAGGTSRQAVQQRLLQLIRNEDCARPYSDEALRVLLAEQGITIARRTVTKYREQLKIPPAGKRKSREARR